MGEHFAMLVVGKAPAQFVPQIFEFGLALNRLAFGEISDRVIAADRQLGFLAPRGRGEDSRKQ
jgi:hypothetical protein